MAANINVHIYLYKNLWISLFYTQSGRVIYINLQLIVFCNYSICCVISI